MKKNYIFIFFVTLSLFIFAWDSIFLYPVRLFLTLIHESFHGLSTFITGGSVHSINLDGLSGKILSSGGYYPFISISGYIGSAMLGAFLIGSKHRSILISIVLFYVSFMLLVYTKFSMEFFIVGFFSAFVFYLLYKGFASHILGFILGSLLVVASFEDIKTYLFSIPAQTDSGLLANYFGMPFLTLPISLFISLSSLFLLYLGMKSFLNEKVS